MTKSKFIALQNEWCDLEMEVAKGQDTPEIDARIIEIELLIESAPWKFEVDTNNVISVPT